MISETLDMFRTFGRLKDRVGAAGQKCCSCGSTGCGTLACTCRPRFFAGQLLTDLDLNALEDYVVRKNRVHNRFLHGWGVVCGLEVVCDPCSENVTVKPGYALGPCGEDIIVCDVASADIRGLIREYNKEQRQKDRCNPSGAGSPGECTERATKWVLSVCYEERLSRGTRPLKGGGSSCGCGGSGSCSCGCGSKNGKTKTAPSGGATTNPLPCEPNEICETFRFKIKKAGLAADGGDRDTMSALLNDPLGSKFFNCLLDLVTRLPKDIGGEQSDRIEGLERTKSAIVQLLRESDYHNCLLLAEAQAVVVPQEGDDLFESKFTTALETLVTIVTELFKSCICSSLLPPCDDGPSDGCVPLAEITVRGTDCKVVAICNWSERRFAVSVPMLGYWFGWLTSLLDIRGTIEDSCCADSERKRFTLNEKRRVTTGGNFSVRESLRSTDTAGVGAKEENPLTTIASKLFAGSSGIDGLESLPLAALGFKTSDDKDLASVAELKHPLAAFMLGQVAMPIARSLRPQASTTSTTSAPEEESRLDSLEKQLASLKKTVAAQEKKIKTLSGGDS